MNDFNIQAASMMSGVSVHQIRAWEKRYSALTPKRLGNNFRSYSQENITRLKLLGELTRRGIAISKIANLNTEELEKQYDYLMNNESHHIEEDNSVESTDKLELLINFLRAKRFDLVNHEILKLKTISSVSRIIIPLMKYIMKDNEAIYNREAKNLLNVLIDETSRISNNSLTLRPSR